LKGEVALQGQIGDPKILVDSTCKVLGNSVESSFFKNIRFTSVDQTSLVVGGTDYRYLRIKPSANVPITLAEPDTQFK
jgi:hypothetical protein